MSLPRETNLQNVQLEVIELNWAQKVYARCGFVEKRHLAALRTQLTTEAALFPEGVVSVSSPVSLLTYSDMLHGKWVHVFPFSSSLILHNRFAYHQIS